MKWKSPKDKTQSSILEFENRGWEKDLMDGKALNINLFQASHFTDEETKAP